MPTIRGSDITIKRGETLVLEVEIFDSDGLPYLLSALARWALKTPTGAILPKDMTVTENVAKVVLSQAETLALANGIHRWEVRVLGLNTEVDSLRSGKLIVQNDVITTALP